MTARVNYAPKDPEVELKGKREIEIVPFSVVVEKMRKIFEERGWRGGIFQTW